MTPPVRHEARRRIGRRDVAFLPYLTPEDLLQAQLREEVKALLTGESPDDVIEDVDTFDAVVRTRAGVGGR